MSDWSTEKLDWQPLLKSFIFIILFRSVLWQVAWFVAGLITSVCEHLFHMCTAYIALCANFVSRISSCMIIHETNIASCIVIPLSRISILHPLWSDIIRRFSFPAVSYGYIARRSIELQPRDGRKSDKRRLAWILLREGIPAGKAKRTGRGVRR